jgi:uncharacterized protein (DUF302 family)
MMNVAYKYVIETERPFDNVVADVEKLTAEKSFRVLHIHDVQATLAEKGFKRQPAKIIEICNAKFAHEALAKDSGVSLFMPCKINVIAENGKTLIMTMRPSAIAEFMPEAGIEDLAGEVDKVVTEIVDRAAQGE